MPTNQSKRSQQRIWQATSTLVCLLACHILRLVHTPSNYPINRLAQRLELNGFFLQTSFGLIPAIFKTSPFVQPLSIDSAHCSNGTMLYASLAGLCNQHPPLECKAIKHPVITWADPQIRRIVHGELLGSRRSRTCEYHLFSASKKHNNLIASSPRLRSPDRERYASSSVPSVREMTLLLDKVCSSLSRAATLTHHHAKPVSHHTESSINDLQQPAQSKGTSNT